MEMTLRRRTVVGTTWARPLVRLRSSVEINADQRASVSDRGRQLALSGSLCRQVTVSFNQAWVSDD